MKTNQDWWNEAAHFFSPYHFSSATLLSKRQIFNSKLLPL